MIKKFLIRTVLCAAVLCVLVFLVKVVQLQFVKYNQPDFLTNKRILVTYYSRSNNTENIAKELHKIVGGDIKKITTVDKYPDSVIEMFKLVQNQKKNNILPKIDGVNIDDYDVIFVGSPIWAGAVSLPVQSFLKNSNFNGKVLVPFVSYQGGANRNDIKSQVENLVMENSKAVEAVDEVSTDSVTGNKPSPKVLTPLLTFASGIIFLNKQIEKWLNSLNDR